MTTQQQNPDGTWSEAEPIGWLEEHSLLARVVLFLRGKPHCGKSAREW